MDDIGGRWRGDKGKFENWSNAVNTALQQYGLSINDKNEKWASNEPEHSHSFLISNTYLLKII